EDVALVNYVSDPNDWFVLLKAPSAWRVLVPVEQSLADEEILSDTFTDSVFEAITGLNIPINTNHRTIYRVHQRVVESMHQNRIVLAGDAAHLNNPLGGFGMNGGLHDAWNVSWKLKSIIKDGENPQELLSLYDKQRRAVMGEFVQSQTIRNKKMIEESGNGKEKSEWTNMRAIHADPNARREFMFRQCMAKSLMDEKEIK
ncbi:FAD-dependent monooxygenase, partial [Myxococcota bacterium]|nr:FAD-dependent monooxygenase [Myxococcota bacterium]